MEKITLEQVEHVANLSRLTFSEEEKKVLAKHLAKILDYIDKLNELDTTDVPPTSHVIPVMNVLRPDEVRQSFTQEEALSNAPKNVNNMFEVPKIVE